MLKNFVIHGVGEAIMYDFRSGNEILRLRRMESTGWTISYDETDVMGGDDLDTFENFETARTQTMTFQNNEFDIRMLHAATGKKAIQTLSAPVLELSEGAITPSVPGPYVTTLKRSTAAAASVRAIFNETREELAPKPVFGNSNLALNIARADFVPGTVINVKVAAVVAGRESVVSEVGAITVGLVAAGVDITIPSKILDVDINLPAYDVAIDGFNVYWQRDGHGYKKANVALVDAGSTYELPTAYLTTEVLTVTAGLTTPPTIEYEVDKLVTPFSFGGVPSLAYSAPNYLAQDVVFGFGLFYHMDSILSPDTGYGSLFVYAAGGATWVPADGTPYVVLVNDVQDYSAVLIKQAATGKHGTVVTETSNVGAFIGSLPAGVSVVVTITDIFTNPVMPPGDFAYVAGALAASAALRTGYFATRLFFDNDANTYDDDILQGTPGLGANVFISALDKNQFAASHTNPVYLEGISQGFDVNCAIINNGAGGYATLIYPANLSVASLIPAGWVLEAEAVSVFSKPAVLNGDFIFNASALTVYFGAILPVIVPTTSGQYTVSGNVVTLAPADAGIGVLFDYVWTTSADTYEAEIVDILSECLRRYVKIVLKQKYRKDDIEMGMQAVIHKAKYTGDFTLESTRADAATHSMEFKIFDPDRADGKIVSITKFAIGEAPAEC